MSSKPLDKLKSLAKKPASGYEHEGLTFENILGDLRDSVPVDCELRDALITNSKGETVFEQKGVLFPKGWSQMAVNIVASKYFHGKKDSPECESSLYELVGRVVSKIKGWGAEYGYFKGWHTDPNAPSRIFAAELRALLEGQYVAFNSPVWFNVGCERVEPDNTAKNWHWDPESKKIISEVVGYTRPQCSACFINSVEDNMESILDLVKTEGMLFKWGSGTGTNLSTLRSSAEQLSGGGIASGPVSFMRGYDAFAGVIKSAGKTRRAAKMVILNALHPDIEEFIMCKGKEEAKARALMSCGYDGTSGPESEAYLSIAFQNANNSVRVTDEFMQQATTGDMSADLWDLKAVRDGHTVKTVNARDLLMKISEQTWKCGDPGMQFDTTINKWHTVPNSGRQNSSNPCSEYMHLDDSACNLASFNLLKFYKDGVFDVKLFRHAIRVMTIAMDIIVDGAGYPTEKIAKNSHDYRPLGLGYANLGALLMSMGLAYDSDKGREVAALITSVLGGQAYLTSAEMAEKCKPLPAANDGLEPRKNGGFPGYEYNDAAFMNVIGMHREAASKLAIDTEALSDESDPLTDIHKESLYLWRKVENEGHKHGFRNGQVTVLAPTGTIGFMMDCDTTGIEPMISLVTYKKMVGGGFQKLTYPVVKQALYKLGYSKDQVANIRQWIEVNGTVVGSDVEPIHYPIFDCALAPKEGRQISPLGHVRMMEVTQPFLSGAISKTINCPESSTVQDIFDTYVDAWKRGLKAVAIYRDGSKKNQPMVTKKDEEKSEPVYSGLVSQKALIPILQHLEPGPLSPRIRSLMNEILGDPKSLADVLSSYDLDEIATAIWAKADRTVVTDLQGNLILGGKDGSIKAPELDKEADASYIVPDLNSPPKATRHRLADTRKGVVHKFSIAGHEGYLHVGLYPHGEVGEIFITMAKEGSTLSGLMDAYATVVSIGLQHGVPLKTFIDKMSHSRFEPSGWSQDSRIGYAKSIMDYIFRWLKLEYLDKPVVANNELINGRPGDSVKHLAVKGESYLKPVLDDLQKVIEKDFSLIRGRTVEIDELDSFLTERAKDPTVGNKKVDPFLTVDTILQDSFPDEAYVNRVFAKPQHATNALAALIDFGDAPTCSECGAITVRNGACFKCLSCGGSSGCS